MEQLFLMFMPSGGEVLVILVAILLLFGGKKIPELMRGLGRGIREFNDARDNVKKSIDEGMKQADREREEQRRLAAQQTEPEQLNET